MWEPAPDWVPMIGGMSPSTLGVWRAAIGDRAVVIKRLAVPVEGDSASLSDPQHFAYWRRAADVVTYELVTNTPGLIGAPAAVQEDAEGISVITEWVEDAANSGLTVAMAMGRFATAELEHVRWLARNQMRSRIQRLEHNGGWSTLGRTTVSDLADALWIRRHYYLEVLDRMPQVAQHGDPSTANLPGREGSRVVAIDWSTLGYGPVGADLGIYSLQAREDIEPLLDAYLIGLREAGRGAIAVTGEEVLYAAQVMAVFTVMTRAEHALASAASGEGPLAAKYRHPAVAPHLRAIERQSSAIHTLLGG